MNRRQFLKNTLVAAGAVALPAVSMAEKKAVSSAFTLPGGGIAPTPSAKLPELGELIRLRDEYFLVVENHRKSPAGGSMIGLRPVSEESQYKAYENSIEVESLPPSYSYSPKGPLI